MITCTFCCKTLDSVRGYVLHCRVHRNEPSCVFKCLGTECKRTFCTYAAFKTHFYRVHNVASQPESAKAIVAKLKCTISLCGHRSQTVKEVVAHLKEHIMEGRPVACPVKACKKVFSVKSSFTAHMSRKHRDFSVDNIDVLYKETTNKIVSLSENEGPSESFNDALTNESHELSPNFNKDYLRNLSLFYLKLQGQLLLPASTIQNIVEEMQNVHELGMDYTLTKVKSLLKDDMCLADDAVAKICDCVRDSDLFSVCHHGPLRTTYSRTQTLKKMLKYTEPKQISLGSDENMTQRFSYYIPIKQTLSALLESDLWKNSVLEQSNDSHPDVFCDISDGQNFKCNQFFIENPGCLKLILYQDSFEIVNPLGSAKKKHKVVAIYLSVANLPAHVRSSTDHMSLVSLCSENDLKQFGTAKVCSELLMDLRDLEEHGIIAGEETVKGALFCIAGDNLGSHSIGGFTENFSTSQYFCRYCEITRKYFLNDPNACGPQRTPEAYNLAVHHREIGSNQDIKGVKKWLSKHFYAALSVKCCPILQRLQKTFSRRLYSQLE
ncbi:uncharacterized protein LOC116737240 isoform X1 [Xiphophorus hellerii]|uniref:uncharacterized protein LOC116737240 isoform X1 n=1 Tax=Xiphophorus hellerii TaxID=8084 RepID=UPI0013B367AD|nr:uncharacterized protein LOC116737240 isoform X1 [Xiphophorus hellerii]XP_032446175.1 uncharacterized protein LOC116737240 isoform X1 [Xiphophorus hellerii]